MLYPRNILPSLEAELNKKEVVVITGMRQVGKTTLLKDLYDKVPTNKALLDAGNPLHRSLFEEHNYDRVIQNLAPFGIVSSNDAFIFIDEIQCMPEISQVIKYLYDHYQVKFFVTGSSSYYLKNLFPESLAGRKILYELYPLSFSEFLVFKNVTRDFNYSSSFEFKASNKNKTTPEIYDGYYDEYLEYGGFPGVVLEPNFSRKKELLEGIFKSYFEIDIKTLADFKKLSKLRDLILLLIPRIGSRIDVTKLASEIEVSRETVYSYLSFLEQTYFISLVPKYSKSVGRSSAGSKKFYLCDSGLANYLARVSTVQLLENNIYQNLRLTKNKVAYFTKKSGLEIDFILGDQIMLEVKQTASKHDITITTRLMNELNIKEGYVISKKFVDESGVILAQDI